MYTQCPDCSTVFRVTAEALRAAQGRVRCGICSTGFDALENLSEAPIARSLDDAAHEDTITVEELPGNEFIELSAAANVPEAVDTGETDLQDPPEGPAAADVDPEVVPAEAEPLPADEPEGKEGFEAAPTAPGAADATEAPGDIPDQFPPDEEPAGRAPEDGASPGRPGDSEPVAEAAPDEEDVAPETRAGEPWSSAGDAAEVAAGADAGADADLDADADVDVDADADVDAELDTYGDLDADADVDVDMDAGPERPAADLLDSLPDTALEFHGSAEDLERLFVPAGAGLPGAEPAAPDLPQVLEDIASQDLSGIEVHEEEFSWTDDAGEPFDPGNPAHVAAVLASSSGTPGKAKEDDLDRTDEHPVLVLQDDEAQASPEAAAADDDTPGGEDGSQVDGERVPEADAAPLLIIPEELRRGPSSTASDDLDAPVDLDEEAPRRWPFIAAAAVLALALGAQAVHHWRLDLARDPATGPWILGAYQAFGIDLPRPVDLASFELRQLGAASDPGQAGRIRVRASIVNHAPFAQPYPLLRLTLQDRFGSTIGARNLGPTEYLPGAAVDPSGLLGASQRADAEVVFVDPGREAVGFELDVCTEGDAGLRCSADLPRSAP